MYPVSVFAVAVLSMFGCERGPIVRLAVGQDLMCFWL